MDDPFADAPTVSPAPLATARAPKPPQVDDPFSAAPAKSADPFADAPQAGKGMGYPSLGLVPPSAPGTPSEAPMGGNVAFYGGLAKKVLDAGSEAPSETGAQGADAIANYLTSKFPNAGPTINKGLEKAGSAVSAGFNAAENATEGLAKFLLSQPSGILGAPPSVAEGAGKLAKDIGAYLFEGGNIADVGGATSHITAEAPRNFVPVINDAAKKYGVEPGLLARQLQQENGFKVHGTSPAGAQGIAQFIPGTAEKYGVDVNDPVSSINGQAHYMSDLKKMFGGNDGLALAGYNWGEGHVQKWLRNGADPSQMPTETRNYVKSITGQSIEDWMKGRGRAPEGIRARALGAEATGPREAPIPNAKWFADQDDAMFRLRQQRTADQAHFMQLAESMPDEFKTPEMQEKFYKYMEDPNSTELSPGEQTYYTATFEPLKREERDLYEELKKTDLDVSDYDPTYAHRIVKGRSPVFDALGGERGAAANPISGYKSLTAPSLKARKFFALEDGEGNRRLVSVDGNRLAAIRDRVATPLQPDTPKLGEDSAKRVGDTVTIDGKTYTLKNATTDEIEKNTNTRYYKNAAANTIDNLLRLRAAARAAYYFNDLKNSPEFATIAKKWDARDIPSNWISPHMPLLSGYKMDPKLAHAIDDFYGTPKSALHEALAKVNQLAVRSLFWSPVAHLSNTAAFWASARSWDWVTPAGIRSVFQDSAKALTEVATLGKDYQEFLKEGSSFVYGGVKNQDYYRQMLQRLGSDVKRDPATWDPIARIMGFGPSDLVKMIYDGSSKVLWAGSDMFMMQRIYELKRKGLSTREAIHEAEKYIPNYRIPPQVLGSRAVAELLKNPTLTEFSRYHYGAMKQIAHIAKDLVGPKSTGAQRFDALGKVFVTGAMLYYAWPVISYGIQKLTGDKDLEFGPKGSTRIPSELIALYNGDKNFVQVMSNLVTIAPLLKTVGELYTNLDWFTGDKIDGPVDQVKGPVHQAARYTDFAASQLAQPYGMLEQAGRPKHDLATEALKTGLGLRKKPKKYTPSKYDWRKDARRKKGLIEQGLDKL